MTLADLRLVIDQIAERADAAAKASLKKEPGTFYELGFNEGYAEGIKIAQELINRLTPKE